MERLFHPMMCIFFWYGYIYNDHHPANHKIKSQVNVCCKAIDESGKILLLVSLSFLESGWDIDGRSTDLTNV